MKKVLAVLSLLAFIGWGITSLVLWIQFNRNCEGFLKRSADSNNIELAAQELDKAIAYIESNNLTSGYTSIIYTTPDEDLGFWYSNLKSAQNNLKQIDLESVTDLEESNLLMKLRETLLDHTSDGTEVTVPSGIYLFPSNTGFAIWGWVSLIILCVSWVSLAREYDL